MLWLLLSLLFIIGLVIIFIISQFFNLLFRGYAPVITTEKKVISKILNEINLLPGQIFYELGSGHGGLLKAVGKKFPDNKIIGIEYYFLPYFTSNIQLIFTKLKNVIVRNSNLLKINLSKANYFYCYLNNELMEKLEFKLKKEGKSGAIIISYKFHFPHLRPIKIIPVDKNEIYIYKL